MGFSVDVLAKIAIELQKDVGHQDRFQRLVTTLRQVLNCDAAALLRYEPHQFIPLAIDGLVPDVLGRRFLLRRASSSRNDSASRGCGAFSCRQ